MEKLIILTACCFSQNPKGKGIVQHFYIFICSDCSKTSQCLSDSDSHVDVSIQFEPWGHYRRLQISLLMWRRYAVASVYCNDMTYCHSVFSLQQISFHLTPLWKQLSLSFFFFLVAFLILTMLHCICSECELKQALMCPWNTIPDL